MSFNNITIGSSTFNSIGTGEYSLNTATFADPQNRIKFTGARKAGQTAPISCAMIRRIEKIVTVNGVSSKKAATVNVTFNVPEEFTTAEVEAMLNEINIFIDATTLNRLLQGEV